MSSFQGPASSSIDLEDDLSRKRWAISKWATSSLMLLQPSNETTEAAAAAAAVTRSRPEKEVMASSQRKNITWELQFYLNGGICSRGGLFGRVVDRLLDKIWTYLCVCLMLGLIFFKTSSCDESFATLFWSFLHFHRGDFLFFFLLRGKSRLKKNLDFRGCCCCSLSNLACFTRRTSFFWSLMTSKRPTF